MWQKRWCTFVCKWHNGKRAVLCRLRSNPQSMADLESSQSAPAVLSRLHSRLSSLAQPEEQPTCQGVGTLSQTRVAGIDAVAGALICYAAWGGLLSCPHTLVRSPAFPQSAIVSLETGWVGQEYGSLLKYARLQTFIYI